MVIQNASNDTTVIKAWNSWDDIIYNADPQLDLILNQKIDSLSSLHLNESLSEEETLFYRKANGTALNVLGVINMQHGEYDEALKYYQRSLAIRIEIGQIKSIAASYNNIGNVLKSQGNYEEAIENLSKGLAYFEEADDQSGITTSINNIGIIYKEQGNFKKATEYYLKSQKICEEIGDFQGLANTYNNLGIMAKINGHYEEAIANYKKSLKIYKENGDRLGESASYSNMGTVYGSQGDYVKSIQFVTKSLNVREEIGDQRGVATSHSHIGIIYLNQEDYENALIHFTEALEIQKKIGDQKAYAVSLDQIGTLHKLEGNYTKALEQHNESLSISEKIGDQQGVAMSYNSLGLVYKELEEFELAHEYDLKSLTISESIGDLNGIQVSLNNIGRLYLKEKDYVNAIDHCERALKIAQQIGTISEINGAAMVLWESYKQQGNTARALEMYELGIETLDSINSEANQKEIFRQEYKYQYERKAAADQLKTAVEIQRHELEATHSRHRSYYLGGGLGVALLLGLFILNRYRVTRKQKQIIEVQKKEVDLAYDVLEERNTEILDSITYAKRIQAAILPPAQIVKEYLADSFILYKPKDIVAGDFYWMEQKEGKTLFAAADCTGHGVPGALVSVICNNGLNRSVREHGLTKPGEILDKTREIVIAEFEKSDEEVRDGMDIALCSIIGNKVEYAGANNPLWLIRKGEIIELKGDKQPIGKYDLTSPFTTYELDLEKGDSIYLFSDGYADQFGGEKGKKLKSSNFKKLLISIQDNSMEEQKKILDESFESWKGDLEQIDDVCVIGVRI